MKTNRAFLMLLHLFACLSVMSAEDAGVPSAKETRLRAIISNYNTIVLGKVTSIGIRSDTDTKTHNKWEVKIDVDEVLSGNLKHSKIKVFIHSPAMEFSVSQEQMIGHRCIWAFIVKDGKIVANAVPFQF